MAKTVSIKPELIRWAIDRSQLKFDKLKEKFPKLKAWTRGEEMPTFRKLEEFARRTMTPFGYLFLDSPPKEELSIPDFRTKGDAPIRQPSPNLIETIYTMQRRQAWMRDFLIEERQDPLDFIGSATLSDDETLLADRIRETLQLEYDWAQRQKTLDESLKIIRESSERIGVLISISGIVGLNTRRALVPEEFRGFVLCDDYAPLVFVNGADSKSAQMFTLAHELVHLWIGKDGLFNLIKMMPHDDVLEGFCNRVAAEFLVPEKVFRPLWETAKRTNKPFHEMAHTFKVSPVVVARRALNLRLISKERFFGFYEQDLLEWQNKKADEKKRELTGGNFYATHALRLGDRFGYAVVRAAREERLLYREAYQLTDIKGATFDRYARELLQRVKRGPT